MFRSNNRFCQGGPQRAPTPWEIGLRVVIMKVMNRSKLSRIHCGRNLDHRASQAISCLSPSLKLSCCHRPSSHFMGLTSNLVASFMGPAIMASFMGPAIVSSLYWAAISAPVGGNSVNYLRFIAALHTQCTLALTKWKMLRARFSITGGPATPFFSEIMTPRKG